MALPGFQCLSLELPPSCVGTSKHRKGLWSYSSPIEDSTSSLLFAPIRTSNGTAKGADSQNSPLVSLTLHSVGWGRGKAQRKQFFLSLLQGCNSCWSLAICVLAFRLLLLLVFITFFCFLLILFLHNEITVVLLLLLHVRNGQISCFTCENCR